VSEKHRPLRRDSLETTTSERLAAIVEAAERAASKVIDDAEAEAQRYLDEARAEVDGARAERLATLVETTNSLIADAEAIRQRSEQLLQGLEQARSQLEEQAAEPSAEAPVDNGGRGSHLSAVPHEDEDARREGQPSRESPAGARLLATQMAVSGNSREEIASRLRNGFQIDDTDAILDAILGPED
jgi:cell division septum initiation protein DivIVA